MKINCDVIQDLLPLYADNACSEESAKLVEEHIAECSECAHMLEMLKNNEIEEGLRYERSDVLEYGAQEFRRQSARFGGAVSGLIMLPLLLCLGINFVASGGMSWVFIVMAALLVAASLILVPIFVKRNKLFWMFCAFTASLMVLLRVISLATGGHWFWMVSGAALFGLSVVFLPFMIKAEPVRKYTEGCNRPLIVIATDVALFLNMLTAINVTQNSDRMAAVFACCCIAGIVLTISEIIKKRKR
ncbi:MAG: zf-HC2 domain-containing protein [Oscillospiraceae bacterium]|nr:zf-HC2 domain-containing protein [Oscillospiraceae bacterium]